MTLTIRPATEADAPAMCRVINRIIEIGGTTAYEESFTPESLASEFLFPKGRIDCHLAQNGADVLGFQALFRADPDWTGPDRLGPEWALISTYVADGTQGQGIGTSLFTHTLAAAQAAGVAHINATIRLGNRPGRAYYTRMGFIPWRQDALAIWQRFDL